ncbi:DNA-formamidopyrimidine glycosylase [candidate division LCP-89 bacterium B3_LCP]|uniref:Formamidopyrimidine-DNA glycosylase n=1 Tax=candidate division LCP-89 bacterium B3_LCP TaxID=2012998 RepID=A0A532UUF8_UNCL8|nr:MAG: DNA-formamidopyrimidine glycosylase [candidate division LCP-89 bacterium B3_LCP]
MVPELPEVETIVCELRAQCLGRSITSAELLRGDMLKRTADTFDSFAAFFMGRFFQGIDRTGKFITFHLDNGNKLIAHLGMTGKFISAKNGDPDPAHLCSRYRFADGGWLGHVDIRRFGRLELYRSDEEIESLKGLGIDPLSSQFEADSLLKFVHSPGGNKRRTRAVHTLLMDQSLIAGIGNIYASEALYLAGIRPSRHGGKLTKRDRERLAEAVVQVLRASIRACGTTISDYRRVDDKPGSFKEMLAVYGRPGEPCQACGSEIKKVKIGGRSAFYCGKCQR